MKNLTIRQFNLGLPYDEMVNSQEIPPDHLKKINESFPSNSRILHYWFQVIPENPDSCAHCSFVIIQSGSSLYFITVWGTDDENHEHVYLQCDSIQKINLQAIMEVGAQ